MGRGRKPLDKTDLHARVEQQTPPALNKKARELGYKYGEGGSTGELLDAIASGRLILVQQEDWEKVQKLVTALGVIQV